MKLLKNSTVFRLYARYTGYDDKIQAGEYMFYGKVSPKEILEKMAKGDVIDRSIRFTITEGLRADQVAKKT